MPSETGRSKISSLDLSRIQSIAVAGNKKENDDLTSDRIPRYMKGIRHDKLKNIQKRNIMMAKKNRLEAILVQKLCAQYAKNARMRALIVTAIEQFLENKVDHLTSDDLIELEKEIKRQLEVYRIEQRKISDAKSSNNNASSSDELKQQQRPSTGNPLRSSRFVPVNEEVKGREWAIINAYQTIVAEDRFTTEEEKKRNQKLNLRQNLDRQILEARMLKEKEKENEAKTWQNISRDMELHREEQQKKRELVLKKIEEERKIREQQVADLQKRKNEEKFSHIQREQESIERFATLKERELEAQKLKRQHDIEVRDILVRSNDEQKLLREKLRQLEMDEDARQMREYSMKLDREALDRDQAFQRRLVNIEKFKLVSEAADVARREREEEKILEERLLQAQMERELLARQKEEKVKEDRRKRDQMVLHENERLRQNRTMQLTNEKFENETYSEKLRREQEEYQQYIKTEKEREYERKKKYNEELKAQMAAPKDRLETVTFTDKEAVLNGILLKKAVEDEDLYQKVQYQLNGTFSGTSNTNHRARSADYRRRKPTNMGSVTNTAKSLVAWL